MTWSVIQTHSNAASVAATNLRRQGFDLYNPVYSERLRGGSFRRVQLFTNYMFVRVVDQWRAILNTVGVQSVLMSAPEKPAEVCDGVIADIRSLENENGVVVLKRAEPVAQKFVKGQPVKFKSNALIAGVYEAKSGVDRAFVLLSLLGAERRVEVKEGDLITA